MRNPSFDDFTPDSTKALPDGWVTGHPEFISRPVDYTETHSGDGGVVFSFPESNQNGVIMSEAVPASPKCCYDLMFWVKGPTDGGSVTDVAANVIFTTPTYMLAYILDIKDQPLDPDVWRSYHLVTPPSPPEVINVKVAFDVRGSGNAVRIDDAILTVAGCGPVTP